MLFSIRNLTIKVRIFLLIAIIIALTLFLAIYLIVIVDRADKHREYRENIDNLTIEYLNLRRFDQQFLLHYKEDRTFFTSQQNNYIKRHDDANNAFSKIIDVLIKSEITQDLNLEETYKDIKTYKDNYNKTFTELVKNIFQRGSDETGIINNMKRESDEALQTVPSEVLKEYVLTMQKLSENYLLNNDEKSYEKFIEEFGELQQVIALINRNFGEVPDSVKAADSKEFIHHVNNYKDYFIALGKINKKIGTNSSEGLKRQLSQEIHKISPEIELINKQTQANYYENTKKIRTSLYFFLIIINVVLIIITWVFFSSVANPLIELQKYTKPLSKGILPKKTQIVTGKDEISTMHNTINQIIESLKKTTDFAVTLGKGVFNIEYTPLSEDDALGNTLLDMRANLNRASLEDKKRKREDETRKWAAEGITKFNDILRHRSKDISKLSNKIISELVNYLGANQGAIYIYNEDEENKEKYLELISAYAYGKEKKRRKRIYPGEGLLGTVAVEKESIYMTDLPDSYLNITSGLGHANPRSLLIVPMKVEKEVFGVIEIASFKQFQEHEKEFTKTVSNNIASSLSITRINLRTARLLQKSQEQAKEMSKQKTRINENYEKLKITQEKSAKREAEMQSMLSAINSSTLVMNMDNKGIITFVNDKMLDLLNVPKNKIIGLSHNNFVQESNTENYNNLWNKLNRGEHIIKEEIININNQEIWFSTIYAPIKNKAGKTTNIITLSTNITENKRMSMQLKEQTASLSLKETELQNNLLKLKSTQLEMSQKQSLLENTNKKLKANEKSLKALIKKSGKQEEDLYQKIKELNLIQNQLREQHENLIKSNKELEAKETEKRNSFNAVDENNLVAEYFPNGTVKKVNKTFLTTLNYTFDEIKNKHQRMFMPQNERRTSGYKQIWHNLRSGNKISTECKRIDKNGNPHYFKAIFNPILDKQGKPVKFIEILTDITPQKLNESLLKGSNENINSIAAVVEFNKDMETQKVNEIFCNLLNYQPKEILKQPHSIFIKPEERDSEAYMRLQRLIKRGKTISDTFIFISKDKKVKYVKGSYSGIKDLAGNVNKIRLSGFDITETEIMRRKIELLKAQNNSAIDEILNNDNLL